MEEMIDTSVPYPHGVLPLISQQRGRHPGCGSRFSCVHLSSLVLTSPFHAHSLKKPRSLSVRETPLTHDLVHSLILSRGVPGNPQVLDPAGASPQKQGWLPMPHETVWHHRWEHWGQADLDSNPGCTHNASKSLSSSYLVICTVG